ncbi:23S rRNA (guanosine(2251)-2'-O)-methyltransferase RlmB [Mycoplasma sp. ATU-Cv-508]|uniref:23S rRNA (guanosine(2251)-2'-O)-methyltransferase RlmB n=1 Tax=Mycoplasma sp. ATU-Cv-508 TaxID=2048001 RepID=UPI0031F2E534
MPVQVKSKQFLDQLTSANHQGYVALAKNYPYAELESFWKDQPRRVLALDHLQDPHNLGALLRTANALGWKHVLIPKDRSAQVSPAVLKVASGGQNGLKIARVNSLQSVLEKFKKRGYWIYGATLQGDNYRAAPLNWPLILVLGSEAKGISTTLTKQVDFKIKIPMFGSVESLNVSVSGGILMNHLSE